MGALPPTRASLWTLLPPSPQLQSFLALSKTGAPIFFLYYPQYCDIVFFFFGQDGTWNVPYLMIIRYSEELCQSSGEIEQIFEDIRFSECHNNDLSYVS